MDRQLSYRTVFGRGRAGITNGNKTCRRLSFFKNFVARGSQGFVGQSSPIVSFRVEQPSVLNKFFSELQHSAAFGRESRKFAGGV